MTVIVRNDRGKVLGRFSRVGVYVDVRGIKQRMTNAELAKLATEMWAYAGVGTDESAGEAAPPPSRPPSHGPICEVCGKRFQDGRGMTGHARTHTGVHVA